LVKKIPHGHIPSLKKFHTAFNHFYKILYPSSGLFEDWCVHFSVENVSEVNDHGEDVCVDPLQEDIYSHQEARPSDQERE